MGWSALVLAAAAIVLLPAGWPAVVLAAVAAVGLAADRRLDWLGAGLLVVVALPFGRGADVSPWTIAGYPIRPQDSTIAVTLLGAAAAVWDRRRATHARPPASSTFVIASMVLLGVGAVALGMGIVADHAMRDVFRDARWWGLYCAGLLAVLGGARRPALLRGLLWGATAAAAIAVATSIGPVIEGGLKSSALIYDRGTMRMQFGNSVFLVPGIAYAAAALLRRPTAWGTGWLALLFAGQVLTLTRTSLLVTVFVVLLVGLLHALNRGWHRQPRAGAAATAAGVMALVVGFAGGIGASELGTPTTWVNPSGGTTSTPEDPLDRITFGDSQSDITTIVGSVASGGRFATYLNAMHVIAEAPIQGSGLGQLVDVRFAYNASRAHTIGKQPGVDNAYLTVAVKAGAVGVAAFAAYVLIPLVAGIRRSRRVQWTWYLAAWLGVLALTVTQSFAVSGYAPFGIALLAAVPFIGYERTRSVAASDHR